VGAKGERQRVEGSFETILDLAGIQSFRFPDLRDTAAAMWKLLAGTKNEQ
jgi:hypothetical protein